MNLRRLLCRIGIHGPVAYRYEAGWVAMSTNLGPPTADFKPEPIMNVGWDAPVCSLCGCSRAKGMESRLLESMVPSNWKKINP